MKSLSRMVVAATVVVAGAGVSSAACVTSESIEPSGAAYPTKQAFCDRLAELVCNDAVVRGCYGSSDSSLVQDKDSCVIAFRSTDTCRPSLDYHSDDADSNAKACMAAWQGVYADAALDADEIADAEEACLAAFHDPGPENVDCEADYDCNYASGLRCVTKPGAINGTCQVPEEIAGGYDCSEINQTCVEGFYCDGSGNCLARENVGDACSSEVLCVEAANCSAPVDGTCVAKASNNSPCQQDLDCADGLCNVGTGSTEGLCAGTITLNQNAAACDVFR